MELGAGSIGAGFGAGSDLALATAIARDIELTYGLGYLGNVVVEAASTDMVLIGGLLPAIAERLRRASDRARNILTEQRASLQAIASELKETGYLSRDDIRCMLTSAGMRTGLGVINTDEEAR